MKVLIEGSEENGRQRLLEVVDREPELMRADVMVIADNGNWKVGEPTLSQTLRGHGKLTVTLRTLAGALHSGHFGGAAPDALLALTRLIATLHDDDGSVAVEGLQDGDWDGAEWPEADFRRQAGVLDGVQLVGTGNLSDRLWARHAISVLGLDAPAVDGAGNIVIPHARAKIAVRVPPGADPVRSMEAVERHLRAHIPWGAQIEIEVEPASTPIALPAPRAAERALEQAYGKPVARMGSGGSVPLVAKLRDAYPDAAFVLWGAQDSDLARIHAANESVDLDEIAKIALAEALLLQGLSRLIPPARGRSPPGGRERLSRAWRRRLEHGYGAPRYCIAFPPQQRAKSSRSPFVERDSPSVRGPERSNPSPELEVDRRPRSSRRARSAGRRRRCSSVR